MIHLLSSLTVDDSFSVQDLPRALQLPLLNDMVVPRIVSSSMTPTIQEGDRLELSPPTSLTVGSIVVFRINSLLVCQPYHCPRSTRHILDKGRRDARRRRGRSVRLCDRSGDGRAPQGRARISRSTPTPVISRSTTDPLQEPGSDCRRSVGYQKYPCPEETSSLPTNADDPAPMDSHDQCSYSCAAPISPLPFHNRLVHAPNASAHNRAARCFHWTGTDSLRRSPWAVAIGSLQPGYRVAPAPPISARRRSGVVPSAMLR